MAKSLQDEMCWDSRVVERATSPTNLRTVESGEDLTRSFRPWIDRAFICFNHNPSSREVPWHSLLLRRRRRTARIGRRKLQPSRCPQQPAPCGRAPAVRPCRPALDVPAPMALPPAGLASPPHGRAWPAAAAHLARPEQ